VKLKKTNFGPIVVENMLVVLCLADRTLVEVRDCNVENLNSW
jgi:hypothetical protein